MRPLVTLRACSLSSVDPIPRKTDDCAHDQMRLCNLPASNTFILTPQSGLAHLYMLETAKAKHIRRSLASLDRCVALRSVGAMVCGCMGVQLNRYARLHSYIGRRAHKCICVTGPHGHAWLFVCMRTGLNRDRNGNIPIGQELQEIMNIVREWICVRRIYNLYGFVRA